MDKTAPSTNYDFGKVAVVMGGWSAERDVSLMSGGQVFEALVASGIDAHPVDAGRDIASVLVDGNFDRAFLILHGRGGEDGVVQGALELAGVPYTGSGVLGSALSMDKLRAKDLIRQHNIPTAAARLIDSVAEAESAAEAMGLPVVLKPVFEGSSIGVSIVQASQQIAPAFHEAARHGSVMMEKFIDGAEVTATVLAGKAMPLITMKATAEFYDYDAKYHAEDTVYECPAPLSDQLTSQIQRYAVQAFNVLGCKGWGRVDFILANNNDPMFMECNTAPGMTSHSLVPMAAAEVGIGFEELCVTILEQTLSAQELAA
ncbi:MAG: D-alanine--D-alanine ligase [Gammaproteobacteria bacterium]|nr:D-alanine--D-alanine ligase [Gammaproteobacteria bacterium]